MACAYWTWRFWIWIWIWILDICSVFLSSAFLYHVVNAYLQLLLQLHPKSPGVRSDCSRGSMARTVQVVRHTLWRICPECQHFSPSWPRCGPAPFAPIFPNAPPGGSSRRGSSHHVSSTCGKAYVVRSNSRCCAERVASGDFLGRTAIRKGIMTQHSVLRCT